MPAREDIIFGDVGSRELIYGDLVAIAVVGQSRHAHGLQAGVLNRVVGTPITAEQVAEIDHIER